MKLPIEMVVRACVAYNVVVIRDAPAQIAGMRAALEAALTDCPREWVSSTINGLRGIVITDVELIGKRVALVVLDD